MTMLFFVLFAISLILFIVALINPALILCWGNDKSRIKVLKMFGIIIPLLFIAFVVSVPEMSPERKAELATKRAEKSKIKEIEKVEKAAAKEVNNEKKEESSKVQKESSVKNSTPNPKVDAVEEVLPVSAETRNENSSEDELVADEKIKNVESEIKKTLADLYPQEILEDSRFEVYALAGARYFIEDYEKQRIKKFADKKIVVYSNEPVHDQAGVEFPYSFLIKGRYEEKGTGVLRDFIMTLGYIDDKSLNEGLASCIQYINVSTGYELNVMDPNDDVLLKMIDALN